MKCKCWKYLGALSLGVLSVLVVAFVGIKMGWLFPDDSSSEPSRFRERMADIRKADSIFEFWDALSGKTARDRAVDRKYFHVITTKKEGAEELVKILREELNKLRQAGEKTETKATSWPMFGGTPSRNMVNTVDKNIPIDFSVAEGKFKNVKWAVDLGSKAYGGPVVAGGRVFVGTNNAQPRDPKIKKDKAILMAFSEADGKFLWQAVHDNPEDVVSPLAFKLGLFSTPVVEKDRIYYGTPGCEIICADVETGKPHWRFDMVKELKVMPFHCGAASPLIAGDLVFVVTGNGIDDNQGPASPKVPSFLALDKNKGTVAWKGDLPGENIIEGQWSNPVLAAVDSKEQVIFPGGDAWMYSFEPKSGKLIWKCNCNPNHDKDGKNYFVGTPVVHNGKLFIGLGVCPDSHFETRHSYVACLDIGRKGDVSLKSMDAKDAANKDSALVWSFGGPIMPAPKKGRRVNFGSTISTCAIHDGLVYINEMRGLVYCLDEKTGERYWVHDFKTGSWGSPYFVDGKVFMGCESGNLAIFAAGKNKKILAEIDMNEAVQSTPVVAGGVLYIMTGSKLYAIAEKKGQ